MMIPSTAAEQDIPTGLGATQPTFGPAGSGSAWSLPSWTNLECNWCLSFPKLCTEETVAACIGWSHPDMAYPAPLPPTPPPAVGAGTSTIPAPYTCMDGSQVTAATNCPEYLAAVDASIKSGSDASKAAQLAYFQTQVPNLQVQAQQMGAGTSILGLTPTTWFILGAAIFGAVMIARK